MDIQWFGIIHWKHDNSRTSTQGSYPLDRAKGIPIQLWTKDRGKGVWRRGYLSVLSGAL